MKTTGVSGIPKFGLLDFLGHPIPRLRLGTAGEDEGELQHAHKVAMMSSRQDHQP